MAVLATLDHYQLNRLLHGDGDTFLYEAHDNVSQRTVAFKAWPKYEPGDGETKSNQAAYIRRFFDEAKLASKIECPGFARYYTSGIGRGNLPGLVQKANAALEHY